MNYYKHHIGDYDSATSHLSWLEDAAYTRLLRMYYRTEKPIPADLDDACRLVRAKSRWERAAVETVLREFFSLQPEGWVNKRAHEEILISHSKSLRNRTVGHLGGRPVKNQEDEKPKRLSEETQTVSENNPSHKPLANSHKRADTRAPQGARLPADWEPDEELKAWAGKERSDLHLPTTIASFRDYWLAKPGAGGRKTDWTATFRNWVRNERRPAAPPPDAKPKPNSAAEARDMTGIGSRDDYRKSAMPDNVREALRGFRGIKVVS